MDILGSSTFDASGVNTAASQLSGLQGLPGGGGGGGFDLTGLLRGLRGPREPQQRPLLTPLAQQNRAQAENAAAIAQANAAAAQARALTERGPQRYIFGLGYAGGPNQTTMDVSRMTGAQRQAYLPQSASFAGGGPSRMELSGLSDDLAGTQRFRETAYPGSQEWAARNQRTQGAYGRR